jgi:hypothetical protein
VSARCVPELYAHECVLCSAREARVRAGLANVKAGADLVLHASATNLGERVCGRVPLLSRDSAKLNSSDSPGFGGAAGQADFYGEGESRASRPRSQSYGGSDSNGLRREVVQFRGGAKRPQRKLCGLMPEFMRGARLRA